MRRVVGVDVGKVTAGFAVVDDDGEVLTLQAAAQIERCKDGILLRRRGPLVRNGTRLYPRTMDAARDFLDQIGPHIGGCASAVEAANGAHMSGIATVGGHFAERLFVLTGVEPVRVPSNSWRKLLGVTVLDRDEADRLVPSRLADHGLWFELPSASGMRKSSPHAADAAAIALVLALALRPDSTLVPATARGRARPSWLPAAVDG